MRSVTIITAGVTTRIPYSVDRDTQLVGAIAGQGSAFVTTDTDAIYTDFTGAAADSVNYDLLCSTGWPMYPGSLKFPLSKDSTIFVLSGASQLVLQLFFDEPVS